MSDNYNIFKVLNFKEKETIHSAMIAAIASHDSQSRNEFFKMLKQKKVIFAENPVMLPKMVGEIVQKPSKREWF